MFIPTIRQQRKRITHERLLQFTAASSQYLLADFETDFGTGDWAFMFALEWSATGQYIFRLSNGNGSISLQTQSATEMRLIDVQPTNGSAKVAQNISTGQSTIDRLCTYVLQRVGNDIELWVNRRRNVITSYFSGSDEFNFLSGATISFGARNDNTLHLSGIAGNFIVHNISLSYTEVVNAHSLVGYVPLTMHDNVMLHWPLTQRYYYNDAGTLRAWDVVEQYNQSKLAGSAFTQGQGTDVGTLVQLGFATGTTNGDGLITITNVTGVSNNNLVGYSVPDPFDALIGGNLRISGSVVSSGGNDINLIVRKIGIGSQSINISVAGTFPFDFSFANGNNSAFEILIQDTDGDDIGATFQVQSLRTDHIEQGVKSATHPAMNGYTSAQLGEGAPSRKTEVIDIYSKELSWDGLLNGSPDGTAVTDRTLATTDATIVDFGNDDWDISFSYRNSATIAGTTEQQVVLSWKTSLDIRLNGNELSVVATSNATGTKTWNINTNIGYDYTTQTGRLITYILTKRGSTFEAYVLFGTSRTLLTSSSDTLTAFDTTGVTSVDFFDTQKFAAAQSFGAFGFISFSNETTPDTWRVSFEGYAGLTQVFDNAGTAYSLTPWTTSDLERSWRRKDGFLPDIRQGLTLSSSRSINIPQAVFQKITGEDIDIILEYRKNTIPVAATQTYISLTNATDSQSFVHRVELANPLRLDSLYSVTGDSTQEAKDMVVGVDDQLINVVISFFERDNVTTTSGIAMRQFENSVRTGTRTGTFGSDATPINWDNFATNVLSGDMLFVSLTIVERHVQRFNRRSFAEKWDNSLLGTRIRIEQGDTIIAHYNSDSAFYSENGSNVLLRELITDDGTTDATVTGFTGATTADQLSDLLTNIVTIDSIR
jgi:hypothetical protein